MDIKLIVDNVKYNLTEKLNIIVKEEVRPSYISSEKLSEYEGLLKMNLPESLKCFYKKYSEGIRLTWYTESNIFGNHCKTGEFTILSLDDVVKKYLDMVEYVDEIKRHPDDLEFNEGLSSIADDWIYWVPIFSFMNGDAFCLDKRDNSIRFLEHDVMDGGPDVHGIKLASSFDKFILEWSKIYFVDIYDWSKGTDLNGINLNCEVFSKII